MIRRALDLGAPVTDAGRERRREQVGPARPSAQLAAHGRDQVHQARGAASTASRLGHRRRVPGRQTRDRSLRTRSTIITFSASSLGRRSAAVRPGALDRSGLDDVAALTRPAQEQLGRRGRDLHARARAGGGSRRTAPGCRPPAAPPARPRRRRRAAARTAPGTGSPGRRRRPRCAPGCDSTPLDVLPASSERRHAPRGHAGPAAAGQRPVGHGRLEPRGRQQALVGQRDRPPAATVERGRVVADLDQAGGQTVRRTRQRASRRARARLRSCRVGHGERVRGSASALLKGSERDRAMVWRSPRRRWRPVQARADVAQLVAHHLAKVRVAGSNPVVRSERLSHVGPCSGGVAERRGNGLQSRVHGFKSRLHLVRTAQAAQRTAARQHARAIGAVWLARFLDTEEVTGSSPVSPTTHVPACAIPFPTRLARP